MINLPAAVAATPGTAILDTQRGDISAARANRQARQLRPDLKVARGNLLSGVFQPRHVDLDVVLREELR
jgi:hypothetical protein